MPAHTLNTAIPFLINEFEKCLIVDISCQRVAWVLGSPGGRRQLSWLLGSEGRQTLVVLVVRVCGCKILVILVIRVRGLETVVLVVWGWRVGDSSHLSCQSWWVAGVVAQSQLTQNSATLIGDPHTWIAAMHDLWQPLPLQPCRICRWQHLALHMSVGKQDGLFIYLFTYLIYSLNP